MSLADDFFIDIHTGEEKELPLAVLRLGKYTPIRVERLDSGIIPVGLIIQILEDGVVKLNFVTTTSGAYRQNIAQVINQQQSVVFMPSKKYTIKADMGSDDVIRLRVFHAQ